MFGSASYGLPSRFLAELPPDLVEREGTSGVGAFAGAARRRAPRGDLVGERPGAGAERRRSGSARTSSTPRSATAW